MGARRLWTDYLFDHRGLVEFVRFVESLQQQGAFNDCLRSIYLLACRRQPRPRALPFEASGGITAPMSFGIGQYSMIPRRDTRSLDKLRALNRQLLERAVELGGRPYLYGWHEFDEPMLRRIYGSHYDELASIRRRFDPDSLFQRNKFFFSDGVGVA